MQKVAGSSPASRSNKSPQWSLHRACDGRWAKAWFSSCSAPLGSHHDRGPGFLLVDTTPRSRYDPGMDMDIQEVHKAIIWACPGRTPGITVGPTRHPLEDDINTLEVRVGFVDDDMDDIIFRSIISAFESYFAGKNTHPNIRVVFSLKNRWVSAYATTVSGRLESADPTIMGEQESGGGVKPSPAVEVNIQLESSHPSIRSNRVKREFFIGGRLHRDNGHPAFEKASFHEDINDSSSSLESDVELQYWKHGSPRPGPHPYLIKYSSALVMHKDRDHPDHIFSTIRDLDVRWAVSQEGEDISGHPLRMMVKKVRSEIKLGSALPLYGGFIGSGNEVLDRTMDEFVLYWPLRSGTVVKVNSDELFKTIGVLPKNISWTGKQFFRRDLDEMAFMAYLMGEFDTWKISRKP